MYDPRNNPRRRPILADNVDAWTKYRQERATQAVVIALAIAVVWLLVRMWPSVKPHWDRLIKAVGLKTDPNHVSTYDERGRRRK